ncbi:unnamed protein product [Symbiodinium natans]|uniref:Uncharacterized protein n=1 Tax=Symbiodinium natans TaxID=878477 RepID=A0A812SQ75_9DINO|nr:unnamed protein product [Symbiodinium natans]
MMFFRVNKLGFFRQSSKQHPEINHCLQSAFAILSFTLFAIILILLCVVIFFLQVRGILDIHFCGQHFAPKTTASFCALSLAFCLPSALLVRSSSGSLQYPGPLF